MNVTVIGTGYVGLVAGACFAETGNDVICVDNDQKKVENLKAGQIPIYEPGLEDLVQRNTKEERLKFTTSIEDGVKFGEIIFIAVGTPQDEDGSADLTHVLAVAKSIGQHMNAPKIVVDKSTVPVGTAELVRKTIAQYAKFEFDVVSNPEFLKEGAALEDFMKPDRVVVGVSNERSAEMMKELYSPFVRTNNPIIIMDVVSAEMTKYAANTMLAARVSLMNEFSKICEKAGADIDAVRRGIGSDSRIGMSFLFPGIGYGGSCFPKDVQALIKTGENLGLDLSLSKAIEVVNKQQKQLLVEKIKSYYRNDLSGKTFAIWGLAFKPKTDDTREAPALVICEELLKQGAKLRLFDPEAMQTFESRFQGKSRAVVYSETNYEALEGADALIICTEWNEFRKPNFAKFKQALKAPVIFDGRNIYDLTTMRKQGFVYHSIGRPSVL